MTKVTFLLRLSISGQCGRPVAAVTFAKDSNYILGTCDKVSTRPSLLKAQG